MTSTHGLVAEFDIPVDAQDVILDIPDISVVSGPTLLPEAYYRICQKKTFSVAGGGELPIYIGNYHTTHISKCVTNISSLPPAEPL